MKRVQLIEWGIITIALIFGYKFFEGIFTALVQIFYSLQGMSRDIFEVLLPTIFMIVIYAACFILLIKRSGQLATYLHGNSGDETIAIKIGKKALLQVILIGICLTTIITNIPDIILYLFESFRDGVRKYRRKYFWFHWVAPFQVVCHTDPGGCCSYFLFKRHKQLVCAQ